MCIAILTSAHPSYPLILLSNRDEYLNRPTAKAHWWPPSENAAATAEPYVLGGRDLLRPERGTWLALSKRTGRIAVLTNYREDTPPARAPLSRGGIVRDFVEDLGDEQTAQYVQTHLLGKGEAVGGFSLILGKIGERLAVVSNRAVRGEEGVKWIMGPAGEVWTVGLSNAAFGEGGWGKVDMGERLVLRNVRESVEKEEGEEELLGRLVGVLGIDSLERRKEGGDGGLETYIGELRNTIFVPALGRKDVGSGEKPADEIAAANPDTKEKAEVLSHEVGYRPHLGTSGMYGTQKQTVVLVHRSGRCRFFERTLWDDNSDPVPEGEGDVDETFQIAGMNWE